MLMLFQVPNQISLPENLFFINIHSREPMAALSLSKAHLYVLSFIKNIPSLLHLSLA